MNNDQKIIDNETAARDYTFVTLTQDQNRLVGFKIVWDGVSLSTDDIISLAKGSELLLRTGRSEITCGHAEVTAYTEDGTRMMEFVPDCTITVPQTTTECQQIILPDGTTLQNIWGLGSSGSHGIILSLPLRDIARLTRGQTIQITCGGRTYREKLGRVNGELMLIDDPA